MFDRIAETFQDIFKNIRGHGSLSEKNISQALREVRLALLAADVNYRVVKDIIDRTREEVLGEKVLRSLKPGQQFIKVFHDQLVRFMTDPESELYLSHIPSLILLAGLQGAGKTTLAAKLALMLKENRGITPLLVAADLQRPAAVEQLRVLGAKVGAEAFPIKGNSALKIIGDAIKYARSQGLGCVIVDTAGRLHIDKKMMEELRKIKERYSPDETLLVLDAMTGQDAVNVAVDFDRQVGITGAVLTKLDGDARGGAAISFRSVTGRPIKLVGVGEKLGDLQAFDAARIVSRILGMGDIVSLAEKAQAALDEGDAERWEKKWRKATIDLEDFRVQLRQLKKVGSWDAIMGMLPSALPRLDDGGGGIKRMEAILDSMSREERGNPGIINGSRRERIARGSGTSIQEVNQLLKQFKLMKKMMGKAGELRNKKLTIGGVNWPLS
ncbi:MAG: signal recognition particle protein [Candidatus Euphemobacter frigidus]|nr:signal recognition particle protein [Candidatus Euphemobacter frigidus]MDP8275371.1 signal recognition particle protein [Candidatus Euphemobacter frigidus]